MKAIMDIRVATEADLPALSNLFRETVLQTAPEAYSPSQARAWAETALDQTRFRALIFNVTTFVAEDSNGIVGFVGLGQDGYVASLYVRCDRLRQGVGSALMQKILEQSRCDRLLRLYTEASEFSRGLFAKFGFQLYDTEIVERSGVNFTRYLMEKPR